LNDTHGNAKTADCRHSEPYLVTILLIDNEEYSIAYRELMKQWGYTVVQAINISKGKEILTTMRPDMIMIGDTLSDGDGLAFCKELRATTRTPIVLIDCHKAHIKISHGLDAGADEYIPKHCSFEHVETRIKKLLEPAIKRAASHAISQQIAPQEAEIGSAWWNRWFGKIKRQGVEVMTYKEGERNG
jgi:DNA-binding response OmpR family regulator